MADNTLYYGDNLDILRRYIADESAARAPRAKDEGKQKGLGL